MRGSHRTEPGTSVMKVSPPIKAARNGRTSRNTDNIEARDRVATTNSKSPVRRCYQSDHQIDDHHDAEVHHVNTERLRGRNENGHDHELYAQDDRCRSYGCGVALCVVSVTGHQVDYQPTGAGGVCKWTPTFLQKPRSEGR